MNLILSWFNFSSVINKRFEKFNKMQKIQSESKTCLSLSLSIATSQISYICIHMPGTLCWISAWIHSSSRRPSILFSQYVFNIWKAFKGLGAVKISDFSRKHTLLFLGKIQNKRKREGNELFFFLYCITLAAKNWHCVEKRAKQQILCTL